MLNNAIFSYTWINWNTVQTTSPINIQRIKSLSRQLCDKNLHISLWNDSELSFHKLNEKKQQMIESIALAVIKLADGIRRNNIITFAFILMIIFAIDPGTETSSKLSFRCPFIHKVLSVLHSWFFFTFL